MAVIVELPLTNDPTAREKRRAIRDLIDWIDSEETIARLEQIDLLTLSDRDIEGACGVRSVPHHGRVS